MKRNTNLKGQEINVNGETFILIRKIERTNRQGETRQLMMLAKRSWFVGQSITIPAALAS